MVSLKRNDRGFTIVELLAVIVVIVVMVSLLVTTYSGIQTHQRNTQRTNDLKLFQDKLETYFETNANSHYPSAADINTQPANGTWWIQTNMKGLSKQTIRDPSSSSYRVLTSVPKKAGIGYVYQPVQSDGTTSCESNDTTCASYTLTAVPEGGGPNIVLKSLN